MQWPDLTDALQAIPWAVAGAVATRHYMPERRTRDLDVVVAVADMAAARRQMAGVGFTRVGSLGIGGDSWRGPNGEEIDVLECGAPWCASALIAAQGNRDAQGLPILPLPYLTLMKLASGRAQDIADVSRMLGQASDASLDHVRSAIARYAPADREDVETLIVLGKMELAND